MSEHRGSVLVEAWSEDRNVARRVTAIAGESRQVLQLVSERFGRKPGTLLVVDEAAPKGAEKRRRLSRLTYRERFRRALLRRFTGWTLATVSMEADLEHTLSPAFPRALLRKGSSGWAAIGADADPESALTFGLIWLDYLRAREKRLGIEGLALVLPAGAERNTCLRLKWMDPRAAEYAVLACTPDGYEDVVDLRDYGNLDTRIEPCCSPGWGPEIDRWVEVLTAAHGVEQVRLATGAIAFRVHGLEFARAHSETLTWGLETKKQATASNFEEIVRLAAELGRVRHADAADRAHPLYQRSPESWLESAVRQNPTVIEAGLAGPIYGQVPQFTAGERDVIDLLGCSRDGRLAVIEMKASEDPHLPMQALDYWIRVRWHAERGDFGSNGYFPGAAVRPVPPRLFLVAPALHFHPTNEKVLRYFSPAIEALRVGLGIEWRKNLEVMFRYSN